MRFVMGSVALVMAVSCYVMVAGWLRKLACFSWSHVPGKFANMSVETAIGLRVLYQGTLFLVIGVGLLSRRQSCMPLLKGPLTTSGGFRPDGG